jgi:hypothetical protein
MGVAYFGILIDPVDKLSAVSARGSFFGSVWLLKIQERIIRQHCNWSLSGAWKKVLTAF